MPKPIRYLSKRRVCQMINEEIKTAKDSTQPFNRQQSLTTTEGNFVSSKVTEDAQEITQDSLHENNDSVDPVEPEEHCDVNVDNVDPIAICDRTDNPNVLQNIQFHREDESNITNSLTEDLRLWLSENCISQKAANSLIAIFRKHGHQNELKKDVRSLMKTPRNVTGKIIHGNGGSYFHFGISDGLIRSINKYYSVIPEIICIQLNCDGMSFSKSSNSQFWPLLVAIKDNFYTEPFLVGLFHGFSKPNDFNVFINPFVDEMKDIQKNGLKVYTHTIEIRFDAIICDAPARAYLTLTKSHSGYFSCSKCTQQGDWDKYVNFPEINNPLRTDLSFKNQEQEEYHLGESLLLDLDFGMVSQIPLDYQHLVCLGVAKRLLHRFGHGPKNQKLSNDNLKALDNGLKAMKACIPSEFARQPRALDSVAKWKATECRQFLLYSGPIILKNILTPRHFNHFMAFSVAVRILCDPEKYLVYNDYTDQLLRWFVEEYKKLYGSNSISYNVHNLIHIAKDCKKFGPLDNFSTFKFENYMFNIRSIVKNAPKPLEQVVNRVHEENLLPVVKNLLPTYPVVKTLDNGKIASLQFNGFTLSAKKNENCCLLKDKNILFITNIELIENNQIQIKGTCFSEFDSLFSLPCDSKNFNIYSIKKTSSNNCITVTPEFIKCKCLCFSKPNCNDFVTVPLLQYNN